MEQDTGALSCSPEDDTPVAALQEQLWQMRVQWQWMRETIMRSNDILQTDALQSHHVAMQNGLSRQPSVVSSEHVRCDSSKKECKIADHHVSKSGDFPAGCDEPSADGSTHLGTETFQEVTVAHVKSTLLEFVGILTEAVDYTAQVTEGEFLSLRDHAEEIANLETNAVNLDCVGLHEEKQITFFDEANDDLESTGMPVERKLEKALHRNPHKKRHGIDVKLRPKNPSILKPSTDIRQSLSRSIEFPLDAYLKKREPHDKERKNQFVKSKQCFSSMHFRTQDAAGEAHKNDELAQHKRKLVLVSGATTNPSFGGHKKAHLESNLHSDENFSSQKISAHEWCACASCVRMAKGGQSLCEYECGFTNINEICFELERTSRIMIISHKEVIGAIHLLRRVPPKKWMTWLESLLHFISRSLESCSTFLALCWYAYDLLPSISKCQVKRLLFLINDYVRKVSPAPESNLETKCKFTGETNPASTNNSKLNDSSLRPRQNESFINPSSEAYKTLGDEGTGLDEVNREIDRITTGVETLTLTADEIQVGTDADLLTAPSPNIEHESEKEAKTEASASGEITSGFRPKKAHRDSLELYKAPIRKPNENSPKMSFFARDAMRFRQTHHLGFLFTSAINTVHKMGKDLALILQKLHECSENDAVLCKTYQLHKSAITFQNESHSFEKGEFESKMRLDQKEKSHNPFKNVKNSNHSGVFRAKNYPDFRAQHQTIEHNDQHEVHGARVSCTGHHGPIRGARNSRHQGSFPRTNRSCSQSQKIQRRSRHHPYFPQGCFLMTESEHWSISRKFSKDEICLATTICGENCVDQGNAENPLTSKQYFAEQTRCSDNSNSSILPQSSASESESVMEFDVDSSSTTERNNSSSLAGDHCSRVRRQTACLQHTTVTSDLEGYEETITSTLEMGYKPMPNYKNAENRVRQKYERSMDSSTDNSYVHQKQCPHSCRNAQLQLVEIDSEITEDDYPEPLDWMDSGTEQTMSPFCDTLYPPKSWQTLLDEGRGLMEEWQQLLPQLMRGDFLSDLRKMERPEMKRVDSIILDLLASIGSCLRHVIQEIETHQQLWLSKRENYAQEVIRPEESPKSGDAEAAQNMPKDESFQITAQSSSTDPKHEPFRREVKFLQKDVNSKDEEATIIQTSILRCNSCNKSHEICTVHSSTPAHAVGSNRSLCDGNRKPICDLCRNNSFLKLCTDINAAGGEDYSARGKKQSPNYTDSCDEDSFTDTDPSKIDNACIKNVSVEVNMDTSVTSDGIATALSKTSPCALPGTEEKHGLATADALLISHRRVFLQMLFLCKLEDKNMLRKLIREMCDGLEAALEQSKLLVAARRKNLSAASFSNKKHSLAASNNVSDMQQRQTEYWQKIISTFFDSWDKTHSVKTATEAHCHDQGKTEIQAEQEKKEAPLLRIDKYEKEYAASQSTLQALEEKHRESMMSLEKAIMDILSMASSHPEVKQDAQETVNHVRLHSKEVLCDQESANKSSYDEILIPKHEGIAAVDSPKIQIEWEDHAFSSKSTLFKVLTEELQEIAASDDQALDKIQTDAAGDVKIDHSAEVVNKSTPGTAEIKGGICADTKPTIDANDESEVFKRSVPIMHMKSAVVESGSQRNSNKAKKVQQLCDAQATLKETNYDDEANRASFSVEEKIGPLHEQAWRMDFQDMETEGKVTLSIEQASHLLSYNHASALATAHLLACLLLY